MSECPDKLAPRADSAMDLIMEIERLREALDFYTHGECPLVEFYEKGIGSPTCLHDDGDRARAALGGAS